MEMTSFLSSEIKHIKAKKIGLGIAIAVIILAAIGADRYVNADRVYHLAVDQEEAGNIADAKKGYTDALQMNPWHADANYQLGVLLSKEGKISEALRQMQRALQLKKEPDYYLGLGYLYLNKLKDENKAETSFHKALDLDPKNYYACFMLGNLAERDHNNDKAIRYYEQAIQDDPQMTACYKKLAAIYDAKGMNSKASEYWQDVLRIDPKDKDAKAYFKVSKSAN
ncbi:MAG: tetratricopeptide repeat protein [Candidatus Aquicultor sp.]